MLVSQKRVQVPSAKPQMGAAPGSGMLSGTCPAKGDMGGAFIQRLIPAAWPVHCMPKWLAPGRIWGKPSSQQRDRA